jgi:hypothetical protein
VTTFVLALLTAAATGYLAWSWAPGLLLPDQSAVRLAVFAAAGLSLGLVVASFVAMRASRPLAEPAPRVQEEMGPPRTVDTKA